MTSSGRSRRPTAAKSTPERLLAALPPTKSNIQVVGEDGAKDPEIAPLDQDDVEVIPSTPTVPPR